MLTEEEFDQWAPDYDRTVSDNEKNDSYPFAGYQKIMASIEEAITSLGCGGASILDLGFGTAALTSRLYRKGFAICGVDFSKDMLALAKEKMPAAELYQGDFSLGIPEILKNRSFDFIVGTYSFHHVPPTRRGDFFSGLAEHLTENGRIFIGDLVFSSCREYEACHKKFRGIWDEDEIYFTADELIQQMRKKGFACAFQPVSFCAGVLTIRRL